MEKIIKFAEAFFESHPDTDFSELESALKKNFSNDEVEKYFELMGEALANLPEVLENPMDAFLKDYDEEIITDDDFIIIPNPKEERMRALKVKEWESKELKNTVEGKCAIFVMEGKITFPEYDFELEAGNYAELTKEKKYFILSQANKVYINKI